MYGAHSSEIRDLCSMKCSSKMLQNVPSFWNMISNIVFYFNFVISPNECLDKTTFRWIFVILFMMCLAGTFHQACYPYIWELCQHTYDIEYKIFYRLVLCM